MDNLDQLAQDIVAHRVFTSWEVPLDERDLYASIFMAFFFMKRRELEKLRQESGLIYEYYDHAICGRSVNGYPCFVSFHTLSKSETDELRVLLRLYQGTHEQTETGLRGNDPR